MDMTGLRELLAPLISNLGHANRGVDLPAICERLGLPAHIVAETKRKSMEATFAAMPDENLPRVMDKFIELHRPSPERRNTLQDWLWSRQPFPEIPKRARRDLAHAIPITELFLNAGEFDAILDRLFVVKDSASVFFDHPTLSDEIQRHVYRNPDDWTTDILFEKLGVYETTHRRFGLFLEAMASSDNLPDEPSQRRFVDTANGCLRPQGVELRETGTEGGYPLFTLVSTRTPANRSPKNLIFASSVKPDLRFRDAVDNDVEIVTNEKKVLVYDRPITTDGLRWKDLQQWWASLNDIPDEEQAKRTLYHRLKECLPDSSPPQRNLFDAYHRSFGKAIPELPALLPEVWLHWDPKTVRERGRDALFRFRMDFLMLMPHNIRIVLEVDGKQHYADEKGKADAQRYARMVQADRDLKLSGYEVFRFGGAELQDGQLNEGKLKAFFQSLFKTFKVIIPNA